MSVLSWEDYVAAGIEARDDANNGRWRLGELAASIPKDYKAGALEAWAKEIRVKVSAAREYRTVWRFWSQNSACAEIRAQHPQADYSDFRTAMRLKDYGDALAFLGEIVDNGWSVEQATIIMKERRGKPTPPRRLIDLEVELDVRQVDERTSTVLAVVPCMYAERLQSGKAYRLIIQELEPDAPETEEAKVS
jgi:hypothetical protein